MWPNTLAADGLPKCPEKYLKREFNDLNEWPASVKNDLRNVVIKEDFVRR